MVSQSPGAGATAPLDPSELAATLRPFGESRMLPRDAYTSEAVFEWEQRNFFEGGWICLGRSDIIANEGDQRAESLGRGGVLLMRGQDGTARAFANACRHRGHELLPCSGETVNRPIVLCPYHAWSYRLDGRLRKAPGFDELANFDPRDNGLVELPCVDWHGLLFVDASGGAGPFDDHVAGLEEIVAPYELERLVTAGRHDYVVTSNWKILSENYQECYHCPVIHPELCAASPPKSGDNYVHDGGGAWVGGWMDIREEFATMSLDGSTSATPLRGLDERRRRIVDYVGLFPNVLISLHPDYVMTHVLTPLGPDKTRIVCEWHFSPEDVAREDFSPAFAVDFWDITNRQDWLACESVQRGLSNPHAIPGPLSAEEDGVYQLVTLVARGYAGLRMRTGGVKSARSAR
ncbi:MAG: aromatic ring-hydroxylating oxygenase subunit alpha [Acidimicrobiales bacterium]